MAGNILKKVGSDAFSDEVKQLQERLSSQLTLWEHDPLQQRAATLEKESFDRLISDERMIEVWGVLVNESPDNAAYILHRSYSARSNWLFLKSEELRGAKYYKKRQEQYKKLKGKFLSFLESHLYEERYIELKDSLCDIDNFFHPPPDKKVLYRKLPRKMGANSAEDVYLQMCLVEEMLTFFHKPYYKHVATIVDVALGKAANEQTAVDRVQHNTAHIAKALSGFRFKV